MAVTIGTFLFGGSAPASATSYSTMLATARNACGYTKVVAEIGTSSVHYYGNETSRIFVFYQNGWNCAVHVRNSSVIGSGYTSIQLAVANNSPKYDRGTYSKYAGPVYVYAPNSCIDVWGSAVASRDDMFASRYDFACG